MAVDVFLSNWTKFNLATSNKYSFSRSANSTTTVFFVPFLRSTTLKLTSSPSCLRFGDLPWGISSSWGAGEQFLSLQRNLSISKITWLKKACESKCHRKILKISWTQWRKKESMRSEPAVNDGRLLRYVRNQNWNTWGTLKDKMDWRQWSAYGAMAWGADGKRRWKMLSDP